MYSINGIVVPGACSNITLVPSSTILLLRNVFCVEGIITVYYLLLSVAASYRGLCSGGIDIQLTAGEHTEDIASDVIDFHNDVLPRSKSAYVTSSFV